MCYVCKDGGLYWRGTPEHFRKIKPYPTKDDICSCIYGSLRLFKVKIAPWIRWDNPWYNNL